MAPRIFLIAGEASGDLHGAGLVHAIRARLPEAEFSGIGGPCMESAGVRLLFPASRLAVVGVVEILTHCGDILRAFRLTRGALRRERPDLLVLIDYPEFNLLVAGRARSLGIPVFYYVSPQVWAWRQGRVRKLRRLVDRMAVILPFEQDFYARRGMDVTFVGHPLLDVVRSRMSRAEFRRAAGLDPDRPVVGLLPGSRAGEIGRVFPVMAAAAAEVIRSRPGVQFMVPLAPGVRSSSLEPLVPGRAGLIPVEGMTYEAIAASDTVLLASGTVTLEAAILGTPMVVMYRVSPLTAWLGRRLVRVPFFSLVNLVAGRRVVPELLQEEATPGRLAEEILALLDDAGTRALQVRGLAEVSRALGVPGAADRAAEAALGLLGLGAGGVAQLEGSGMRG